jgi:hypothetical protein
MPDGLNINRLVRVSVNLSPIAAARRGFGVLMVVGDSNVINPVELSRTYLSLDEVANDFGVLAPEYLAAQLYFGQSPRPDVLMIGRWVRTETSGLIEGGILTPAEQDMNVWTPILDGTFSIPVDGVPQDVLGLDFSLETNLNGVASVINNVLIGATCAWDGSRFTITSQTTGVTSSMGFATTQGTGTDISSLLKLTSTTALTPVPGFDAESPLEAVVKLAEQSSLWYGLTFAASTMPDTTELVNVAGFIESTPVSRIFGVTETNTLVLDAQYTADLASVMKDLEYKRTTVQYSDNPYAVSSLMGRAFSVNFNANKSTITLMYKQEPGVVAQTITETQANTLKEKRCNVFVNYINDTAIIQYGVMSGPAYFDEIHGLDWFTDSLQNAEYNLLYTSKTKVPQTDAGQNQLVSTASSVCNEAVNNGLIAPGQWNAAGFGQLETGDYLQTGYYIFTPPVASQPQAIREQRIAPPLQIALKLAGAIHEIDCIVDVNR